MKEVDEERIREIVSEELEGSIFQCFKDEIKDLIKTMIEDGDFDKLKEEMIEESKDEIVDAVREDIPMLDVFEQHFRLNNGTLHLENVRIED